MLNNFFLAKTINKINKNDKFGINNLKLNYEFLNMLKILIIQQEKIKKLNNKENKRNKVKKEKKKLNTKKRKRSKTIVFTEMDTK